MNGSDGFDWSSDVVAGDTTFLRSFAGHLEDGQPSVSEPALGRTVR
jgi:phospholipase C